MTKEQLGAKCTERAKVLQNLCKEYKKKSGEYFSIQVYDRCDADYIDDEKMFMYLKPSNTEFIYSSAFSKKELEDILEEIESNINQVHTSIGFIDTLRTPSNGRRKSSKNSRNADKYVPINKELVNKIRLVAKLISEIQKESGHTEVQWTRHFLDSMTGDDLGCQMINEGLAGWDGKYDEKTLFEAKNNTLDKKGNLDANFDNIGDWKIQEMREGGLGVVTAWETFGNPAFRTIFNTKNVADTVERTLGKKRRSTTVSFNQLFEGGAKVVACGMNRRETLKNIREHYPHISITLDDIYEQKELKQIAKEFASM